MAYEPMSDDEFTAWEKQVSEEDVAGGLPLGQGIADIGKATTIDEVYDLLARMTPPTGALEQARIRDHLLKAIGKKLSSATKAVDAWLRTGSEPEDAGQEWDFTDPLPSDADIDGVGLLDEIVDLIRRFVVLEPEQYDAVTLWVTHCYYTNTPSLRISPLLFLTSPQKRCSKTNLLGIIRYLVPRALPTSNITGPTIFRSIEKWHPTLLVDEADSFIGMNEDLRGILNSGHTRDTAFSIRSVGDNNEPKVFSTWAAKALAAIKHMPDTIEDRSLIVRMRRRLRTEAIEPFDTEVIKVAGADLAGRLQRWTMDHPLIHNRAQHLALHDRARDNWSPLLGIAGAAGGDWPARAARAAVALSATELEDGDVGSLLLADIAVIFAEKGLPDLATTTELLPALHAMEDRSWGEWGRAKKPMTADSLRRLLAPYGVRPCQIRDQGVKGSRGVRGYVWTALEDAVERYGVVEEASTRSEVSEPSKPQVDGGFEGVGGQNPDSLLRHLEPKPKSAPDQRKQPDSANSDTWNQVDPKEGNDG
jgi:putative DNA primase/helicase